MWELLIVLYALTSFFALWHECYSLFISERFSVGSFCKLWFIVVQFCLPCYLMLRYFLFGVPAKSSYASISYDDSALTSAYVVFLFSLVAYCVLVATTKTNGLASSAVSPDLGDAGEGYAMKRLRIAAFLCLSVGALCLFLWSSAYGSIFDLIEVGNAVRGGWNTIHNSFAMFKHPSRLVLVSSYIYFALLYSKRSKFFSIDSILLIASVFLSMLFLFANDGRLSMAFYFMGFFLVVLYTKLFIQKKIFDLRAGLLAVVICVLLIAVMLNMDSVTYFIRHGQFPSAGDKDGSSIIEEILFDPASDLTVVSNFLNGRLTFMLVHDFVYGIFAWLPQSLSPSWALRLWTVNTQAVSPMFTTGEIPCGLLAQSVYDLGIVGVIFIPYLYGLILHFTDKKIVPNIGNPFVMGLFAYLFTDLLRVVSYAMLYDIVLDLFPLAIALVIYYFSDFLVNRRKAITPRFMAGERRS